MRIKMKRNRTHAKHLALSCFAMLMPLLTSAHDFEVDGIYYNITSSENLTVEVTFQGNSLNEYCNKYTGAVTIPSTVTYEGMQYSVTNIEESAFLGCTSLISITIPESVTSIGNSAFVGCSSLTSVSIPESVTNIGFYAFCDCYSLTSINIPKGVTSIEFATFESCTSLTSINIPKGVTSIGEAAFHFCSSLTSINIPESVTSIGSRAFLFCNSLTSIICKAITPPSISDDTFSRVDSSIPVYVPSASVQEYQSARVWKNFTNFIGMDTRIDNPEFKYGNSGAAIYDLNGRRITDTESLPTGIYIQDGKKFVVM